MNNFFLDHANMVDFMKTIDWDNITTSSDETTIKVRSAIMDVAEYFLYSVRAIALGQTGLVQQTAQIAAARDLTLFVGRI